MERFHVLSHVIRRSYKYSTAVQLCSITRYLVYVYGGRPGGLTSGSPQMLLVLVREFESRRGEILKYICKKKKKKKGQLLRAPSVGKHNSTQVDEGRAEIFSR